MGTKFLEMEDIIKPKDDVQMTSSILSISSSLTSPVDSGVQLLDSESEITSLMSVSCLGFDAEISQSETNLKVVTTPIMTKSDIDNHNEVPVNLQKNCSGITKKAGDDLMTVSLTSYELLDYTQQNAIDMHVSMSEEVNEGLRVDQADEQIVFRRHRKKKSETPKKRVSFHEDILNNTRIDDIHINHGFITHEPDISMSFFTNGFVRKPDVVKGRYSWAAEGDSPYYQKNPAEREVQSDIYVNRARFSSTSSSSSASISSSVEDDDVIKKEPSQKAMPKSSCLKKSKSNRKYISTNIVEEERKPPETNLLDTNIFGSLKNMFSFSTNVPLAERGVPEGQEDIPKQDELSKPPNLKTNLKLTIGEGFYPNYPNNQALPPNIIVCASNVYEHKGISYSYEYENFKKTFEQQNKPKSSTVYQTLLSELNFFKRKEKKAIENDAKESLNTSLCSLKLQEIQNDLNNIRKSTSTATIDFSDSDSASFDFLNESTSTRHLSSPKRKNKKRNSVCNVDDAETLTVRSLQYNKQSSKTSLINRFLRNVTLKKVVDLKMQKKLERKNYIGLYVKGAKANDAMNKSVDDEIEREVKKGCEMKNVEELNVHLLYRFKHEIFRSFSENLLMVFPVNSAYTTSGEAKTLMAVLTNSTLYITGYNHNNSYFNHFVLPYTELNTILIGPNAQTIHFSNYDNDMQCIVTTGSENLTNKLMGQLEMAIRKDINKPKLPAVKQLTMRDMNNLRRVICKQTPIEKDTEFFHYSVINILDYNSDSSETPLGPSKEGPLMFRTTDGSTRWETAYFILKAGILYMLSSPTHRLPMRVLPIINGACQGAQRIYNASRPYTFQVQISGVTLYLAAPDEYVASEWLQTLVQAASKTYTHREKMSIQSCSLLMTSEHVLIVREAFPCVFSSTLSLSEQHQPIKGTQIISCAAIADITAFRLPCAEQSWCILEFACREVLESSGDWIIYFATNAELEKFISTFELLWAYHNEQSDCTVTARTLMKRYHGRGVLNLAINRLPFELHLPGYRFCGPGTKLQERLERGDVGHNPLDEACKAHDIVYDRFTDLETRHKADERLAEAAFQRRRAKDASIGEKIAALDVGSAMKTKVKLGMGGKKLHPSKRTQRVCRKFKRTGGAIPFKQFLGAAWDKIKHVKPVDILKTSKLAVAPLRKLVKDVRGTPRVITIPKTGGILPLIPIFAALSALGALSGVAARIAKAVNDAKSGQQQLSEAQQHNQTMESIALGRGLYLKPYRRGFGLYVRPYLAGEGLQKKKNFR